MKSLYTASLQEGEFLNGLLDLTFDILGINQNRPFEPNRDLITTYPLEEEDWSSGKLIKQLLVHLYYLSLKHTPFVAKSWWLGKSNRQTVDRAETLTEKYISPLLISSELTSVITWSNSQPPSGDDTEVKVKVSKAVREATIIYPVDDQTLEMLIRLPPAFPLGNIEIQGTKKVGFTDRQWKGIELETQAVVSLQGGSILDALLLFKKNIELHFKGVEECAICYSIVGAERTLPGKSCATCRNKFHAGCLYKWFKTSGGASCPLCRNNWQFYAGVAR